MYRAATHRLANAAALLAALATPALAQPPGEVFPALEMTASLAPGERGAFCTRYGCLRLPGSPLAMAAGFGLAVVAAGWVARRRRAH